MAITAGLKRCLALLVAAISLWACDGKGGQPYAPDYSQSPPTDRKVYVFGVHPLHNPEQLDAIYSPLLAHVSTRLGGVDLRLEASSNYAHFERKLAERRFDFALPNPYQVLMALRHGYRVFAKMGDDQDFHGILLARKDGPIRSVADLKGKAVSYPAPTALAATMLPQRYLHDHGIDVTADIENRYVGSQESSIMNVVLGNVAAGATWPQPWRNFQRDNPDAAAQLHIIAETPSLPSNGLIARDDVPAELVGKVGAILVSLHESPEGRALLQRCPTSRFDPATDATYDPVRDFLVRFNANVRPVDLP
ncbi:MAG TPA: phosphate/phosphite/phosphonate ABC transporter substrate-binding protein [Candidatus Omnitrophota bacterium]|nr:phosphate/phosphite/phosphonate ABC transporter substrate-binding protein [Candidatus Omnitrophota bacterium]